MNTIWGDIGNPPYTTKDRKPLQDAIALFAKGLVFAVDDADIVKQVIREFPVANINDVHFALPDIKVKWLKKAFHY